MLRDMMERYGNKIMLFISYTRDDASRVEPIEKLLNESGIQTWRDTVAMPLAVNWDDAVIEALCRSSFAVIIDSEKRREKLKKPNSAVQREHEWIEDLKLTYKIIDIDENPDAEMVANDLIAWMKKEKEERGEDIENVRYLVSKGYAYKNNVVSFDKYDVPKGFFGKIFKLLAVRMLKEEMDLEPDFGTGPLGLREPIYGYLRKLRIQLVRGMTISLLLFVSIILVIVLGVKSGIELYTSYTRNEVLSSTIQGNATFARSVDTDVIMAASSLNSDNYGSKYVKHFTFFKLMDLRYPDEYYEADSAAGEIASLTKNTVPDLSVRFNQTNGIVDIYRGQDFCRSFVIDGVPSDYDWSEDGKCIALCTANRVYLYYPDAAYEAEELTGNSETVRQVYVRDRKVYAVTENDNLVVWDISPIRTALFDNEVKTGRTVYNDSPVAAYISGNKLVLNSNNQIYEEELPGEIADSVSDLVFAHSGNKIALLGNDSDSYSIFEYDIGSKIFTQLYTSENTLGALDYSYDDSSVFFGDWSDTVINRIDLSNGSIVQSSDLGNKVYSLKAYDGGFVAGFTDGTMVTYNNKLKAVSKPVMESYGNIPAAISVSGQNEAYFIVSRNANNSGSAKYHISGEDPTLLIDTGEMETAANTAVSVSNDGSYVAFGNDDGQIVIWRVNDLYPVWRTRDIKDGIVSICFSGDDKEIAVLGRSGTVYTLTLGPQITNCSPDDYTAQLSEMRKQIFEMYDQMKRLGLTDYTYEEFMLQKRYDIKSA